MTCAPGSGEPRGELWAWAVATYERPGVKDALLALQNRHDIDAPLLLWRLWLLSKRRQLDADAEAKALALSADWRSSVVSPLRAARDRLRHPPAAVESAPAQQLRRDVLAAELAAEKLLLDALEALSTGGAMRPPPPADLLDVLRQIPELSELPPTDLFALAKALEGR